MISLWKAILGTDYDENRCLAERDATELILRGPRRAVLYAGQIYGMG